MAEAAVAGSGLDRRRWGLLWVIGLAQLMVVLDLTVMNIALPSAQRALHFSTVDRQWVVTAYTLSFGSLLLLGGKLSDLLGRKVPFLAGLAGFAGVSAIGGASVNFAMPITARACQGVFAALLVPSALSLLTTTFTEPKERNTAFGAIAGAGGAVGLLLGGLLTRVPVLAVDAVYEPDLRRGSFRRRGAAAGPPAVRGPAEAGHPGRAAGGRRHVLPGVRVRQRGLSQLGHPVHLRFPRRRRGTAGRIRGLAGPGRPPAVSR